MSRKLGTVVAVVAWSVGVGPAIAEPIPVEESKEVYSAEYDSSIADDLETQSNHWKVDCYGGQDNGWASHYWGWDNKPTRQEWSRKWYWSTYNHDCADHKSVLNVEGTRYYSACARAGTKRAYGGLHRAGNPNVKYGYTTTCEGN